MRLQISISEEAYSKLSKENKSKHIEDLIMGRSKVPWLDLEYRIDELKELILAKEDTGLECCKGNCKHWVYSMDEGALVNELSGEVRSYE